MSEVYQLRPVYHGRYYTAAARFLAFCVLAFASLMAAGWLFDIHTLRGFTIDWMPMRFNSALCFVCIGAALLLKMRGPRRRASKVVENTLAAFICAVGALTLLQYATGIDLGIDELLLRDTVSTVPVLPGRISFVSAVNFTLIGFSLLAYKMDLRGRPVALHPALAVLFISYFSLLGSFHDIDSYLFYRKLLSSAYASLLFILSSIALLLSLHRMGFMKSITSGNGGVVAGRLIPLVFILPFVFGGLELYLVDRGILGHRIATALHDSFHAVILTFFLYYLARLLNTRDLERETLLASIMSSEERYRLIADHMGDNIFFMDTDFKIVFTSPSVERSMGYAAAELRGLPFGRLFSTESEKKLMETIASEMSAERFAQRLIPVGCRLDLEMIRKDGSSFWGEIRLDLVRNAEGKPEAIVGMGRDVSDRIRAEAEAAGKTAELEATNEELNSTVEELESAQENLIESRRLIEESEERYRRLVEFAPDGILVQIGGKFAYMNPAMEEIFGASKEAILGTPILERMHPDFRDTVRERMRLLNEKREAVPRMDQKYLRVDGTTVDVEVSAVPFAFHGEHGALVFVRDVTERKRAEAALERERDRANLYFEIAGVMLLALDSNANISLVNKKGCEILGHEKNELMGRNWFETFVPEPERERVCSVFNRLMKGDVELSEYAENHIVTKDGELRLIAWHNTLLRDDRGYITGTLSSGEDITERERAKERIVASLREKEVLLREIHHRVKNNMQVISSILGLQSAHTGNPELTEAFNEVQQRIKSMSIIHEMLYKTASLADIDMRAYINALCMFLFQSHRIDSNRISLRIDIENIFLEIGTAVPLGLIANELISNALKYAFPGGGRGSIMISMRRENGEYAFSVRDDGVGLPDGFDAEAGSTLGLRLVGILVKQLNGSMAVGGGAGSSFSIVFGAKDRGKERHHEK